MKLLLFLRVFFALLVALPIHAGTTIPWNVVDLKQPPAVSPPPVEVTTPEGIRALCFEGPPYHGKPTRVFAFYGAPQGADSKHKVPAVVLVHGAGGTAFLDWVRLWNSRGYAAIAFDNEGNLPIGHRDSWQRNPQGGPQRTDIAGLDQPVADQWMYHAVADTILAHSLIRAFPEVDSERIGITGISWGAVVMANAVSLDDRFQFAAAVYGCGYLSEDFDDGSRFIGSKQSWEDVGPRVTAWGELWDPARFLPQAKLPVLWIGGLKDFAFTPRSRQLSYRAASGPHTLSLRSEMIHGHGGPGESPQEILVFANSIVKGELPLATVTPTRSNGSIAWVDFESKSPIRKAALIFTRDTGRWQERRWETQPAEMTGHHVSAQIPPDAGTYFFNLTDDSGLVVSSEHENSPATSKVPP